MKKVFLVGLSCAMSILSFAQLYDSDVMCYPKDLSARYREHNVDFTHMVLELSFDAEKGIVNGEVNYDFTPIRSLVDTIWLDAPGIEFKSISMSGLNCSWKTNEAGVRIQLPRSLPYGMDAKLKILYKCTPAKGLYFIGWNDPAGLSRKQIWSQGQGIDNRHWIPSYDDQDDKLVTELKVTFDKKYTVISNGLLQSETDAENGMRTTHWKMTKPHAPYLVMLGIGEYKYKDMVSKRGIISRQYYYPDMEHTFHNTYQYSVEMMDYLEKEFGVNYPWEINKNVPVQDYMFGAMENSSATVYTDFYVQDSRAAMERNYIGTNCHELVHQWWGDYITEYSATDHWLHESFATHYAKHFRRWLFGDDWYQWEKRSEQQAAINASLRNHFPVAHSQGGGERHYQKGSFVIDMLRYVCGEENYQRAIRHFLQTHPYGNVSTRDFYQAFVRELGMNLDWFFDEWLYRGGEPSFVVSEERSPEKSILRIEQIQDRDDLIGNFKMPVVIRVHYTDGSYDEKRQFIYGPVDEIAVDNPFQKEVAFVLFDPAGNILKKVSYIKPYREYIAQAKEAKDMIDRYDAVEALVDTPIEKKRADLIAIFKQERFHAVRSAVVKQLVNDDHKTSTELVKMALQDKRYQVRRTVLENSTTISGKWQKEAEQLLNDSSYSNVSLALRELCEAFPKNRTKYLLQTATVQGMNKNVRTEWLKQQYLLDSNQKWISELVSLSSQSYEYRTRVNALDKIEELAYCDTVVVANSLDAAAHFNGRLSGPAIRCIRTLMEKRGNTEMYEAYFKKTSFDPIRQSRLDEKVFGY